MNILVLGGTGFIGSHVVGRLVADDHFLSIGCRHIPVNKIKNLAYYEVDLLSGKGIVEAMSGVDIVIHCASSTVPASSSANPEMDITSNLIGTLKLLEVMREYQVYRIIYLSSGGTVYGEPEYSPVSESHRLSPISSYGIVKMAVERYLEIATREWGLKKVIFRPSNPFGEGQVNKIGQGLIASVIDCALSGRPVTIFGDGNTVRDYIYVKDLAELIARAVNRNKTGVFNAGTGVGISVNEIITTVELISGNKIERHYAEKRSFDVRKIVLDIQKSADNFSWIPGTELVAGIDRQLRWVRGGLGDRTD